MSHKRRDPIRRPAAICRNCGGLGVHARGLCPACYQFQWRTGRPRPVRHRTRCVVCEQPLNHRRYGAICARCYMRAWRRGLSAADIYARQPGAILRAGRAS